MNSRGGTQKRGVNQVYVLAAFLAALVCVPPVGAGADDAVEGLADLTGGAVPIIAYENHDPFANDQLTSISRAEYRVIVRNQTGDPLSAEGLILVVQDIVEMSGKDVSHRVSVVGADGYTAEGRPYFYVPVGGQNELPPYAESEAVLVELDNPDYLRLQPPTLRVRGKRRDAGQSVQGLLETLVDKGILSSSEANRALSEAPSSSEP